MPPLPWEMTAKAVVYASVLTAIGSCAIESWLLPTIERRSSDDKDAMTRALTPVRTGSAIVVLVGLGLRAVMHSAEVFGWSDALSWESLQVVAIQSRWGSAWQLQVAAACAFAIASVWAGRRSPHNLRGWIAAIACMCLCYSMPLLGHGAGTWWRLLLHGTHILGAGVWTGLLAALVLIRVPASQRLMLLRGVSSLALVGASLLILPGVAMAWSYIGSAANLWRTTYGQVLSVKLALFCGVVACGLVNWRRFSAERQGAPTRDHLGPVGLEVVFAGLVVALTAALTELSHP